MLKKFEIVFFHKLFEVGMSSDSNAVAVGVLEDLAQGYEGLNIASGSHDLDDDIELRGRSLSRQAT